MNNLFKITILVIEIQFIYGLEWSKPHLEDPKNEYVTFNNVGNNFEIILIEEKADVTIGILTFDGKEEDLSLLGTHIGRLGTKLQCDGTMCNLIIAEPQDADLEHDIFNFQIKFEKIIVGITLTLKNVDDNEPLIGGPSRCIIEENQQGVGDSTCEYYISDLDDIFEYMLIELNNDIFPEIADTFEFRIDNAPSVNNQKKVNLKVLKSLNYDNQRLYVFIINAVDGAGHRSSDFQVVIDVNDIPNKPPEWIFLDKTKTFKEHEHQNIKFKAIDGDYLVNENILYSLNLDPIFEQKITLRTIENGNSEIVVDDIDRDGIPYFEDNDLIIFTLLATEEDSLKENAATIALFIQDIDDNPPQISMNPKKLEICEHSSELTGYSLRISDIDLGENAQYTVAIADNNVQSIKYSEAFHVVPRIGYQNMGFLLMIQNPDLLDYDSSIDWQKFSFEIQVTASTNEYKVSEEIKIELINWNDEFPQFMENVYSVEVAETIAENFEVIIVTAVDSDGDYKIDFSLSSLTNILNIASIDDKTASITTKGRVFDYETQPFVAFQVVATDSFPSTTSRNGCLIRTNNAYAMVEVSVLDVNDEAPILTVLIIEDITVDENQPNGTIINLGLNSITASDKDNSSNLEFEINWEDSRAIKFGKIVQSTYWKGCLAVNGIQRDRKDKLFDVEFSIIENNNENTPDFELFDTMFIVLTVTDTETEYGPKSVTTTIPINVNNVNDCSSMEENHKLKRTKKKESLEGH